MKTLNFPHLFVVIREIGLSRPSRVRDSPYTDLHSGLVQHDHSTNFWTFHYCDYFHQRLLSRVLSLLRPALRFFHCPGRSRETLRQESFKGKEFSKILIH